MFTSCDISYYKDVKAINFYNEIVISSNAERINKIKHAL